jgi:hypothetical protein
MISQKAIDELKQREHIAWITALKTGQIRALVEGGQLQLGCSTRRTFSSSRTPTFRASARSLAAIQI